MCIPQAEKPELFQIRHQGEREKVGLSLKSAPEPGWTWLDELEGHIAPAPGHTAACCRQGPGPHACTVPETSPES